MQAHTAYVFAAGQSLGLMGLCCLDCQGRFRSMPNAASDDDHTY